MAKAGIDKDKRTFTFPDYKWERNDLLFIQFLLSTGSVLILLCEVTFFSKNFIQNLLLVIVPLITLISAFLISGYKKRYVWDYQKRILIELKLLGESVISKKEHLFSENFSFSFYQSKGYLEISIIERHVNILLLRGTNQKTFDKTKEILSSLEKAPLEQTKIGEEVVRLPQYYRVSPTKDSLVIRKKTHTLILLLGFCSLLLLWSIPFLLNGSMAVITKIIITALGIFALFIILFNSQYTITWNYRNGRVNSTFKIFDLTVRDRIMDYDISASIGIRYEYDSYNKMANISLVALVENHEQKFLFLANEAMLKEIKAILKSNAPDIDLKEWNE